MKITITVVGLTAAAIERAERTSFYGVHGDGPNCYTARRQCYDAIENALYERRIDWSWLQIVDAHSINTEGTKTPYLAEITAEYSLV